MTVRSRSQHPLRLPLRIISCGAGWNGLVAWAAFVLAVLSGCSGSRPVTQTPDPATGQEPLAVATDSLLPRPATLVDSLPPVPEVNLADYSAVMDRARLHVVLARKSLEKGDTLQAFAHCQDAARQLDRATYYPDAESDSTHTVLSRNLAALYSVCVVKVPDQSFDLPVSVMNALFDAKIQTEHPDLTKLTFKEAPATTIPLPLNEDVERNIYFFTTQARGTYERWLERSGRYFPRMKTILKEEGLPDEIIFLTMVESGVNPNARSIAKCVGLWQFLKSTGEMYGLYGDAYCDDRRDPEKATRAAGRHLRDLYNRYKDWHLALAAYNAGAGRIDRAILASKLDRPTFWDIKPLLPSETQNYVPRFIAVAVIGLNLEAYEFTHIDYQDPYEFDPVRVRRSVSLDDIAQVVGADPVVLREMNPHILQGVTPGDDRETIVRVPAGQGRLLGEKLAQLPSGKVSEVRLHKVRRGETPARVAARYGVSESSLRSANDLSRRSRIKPGMVLRIPASGDAKGTAAAVARDNLTRPSTERDQKDRMTNTRGRTKTIVPVEAGMTLGGIADRHGVTISDVMTWNGLPSNAVITPGMDLIVWVRPDRPQGELAAKPVAAAPARNEELPYVRARAAGEEKGTPMNRHRVQRGETLAGIAAAFNVSLDNLMHWNNLNTPRVKTGRVLKIYSPGKVLAGKPLYDSVKSKTPESTPRPKGREYQHRVERGENLWTIASLYKVSVADVMEWNALGSDAVSVGQVLRVYSTDPPVRKPEVRGKISASSAGEPGARKDSTHTVVAGETLYGIARRYGITVDSLKRWNGLQGADMRVGQVLQVHAPVSLPASLADEQRPSLRSDLHPENVSETHIVRRGDRLSTIAKKYGLTMDQIRAWNDIKGNDIFLGQELRIRKPGTESVSISPRQEVPAKKAPESGSMSSYTVEKGETLYGISRKLGVAIEDLRVWNPTLTTLKAGQTLQYRSHP